MIKKVSIFAAVVIMTFGIFCGCQKPSNNDNDNKTNDPTNEEVVSGKFYTLEEAFEIGHLTKANLEQIAYYINNNISAEEILEDSTNAFIKETAAYELRHDKQSPITTAKVSDFTIKNYFGSYESNYVVQIDCVHLVYPADVIDYWKEIGNVRFHITSRVPIKVWRFVSNN